MLKYIWFVLSDDYYEIMKKKIEVVHMNMESYQVEVYLQTIAENKYEMQEALYITDDSKTLKGLLEAGAYAIALYHESNGAQDLSAASYGIEDVELLDYSAFEKIYRRLVGVPWDILETERLFIRESTIQDVEAFYRIYQHPSITQYMEPLYENRQDECAYMQDYIKHVYGFYGYGLWTILLKETGEIIGRAGLSVRPGCELPELGYVIDVKKQRQGYAYEACLAILHYAKEELAFDGVQALTDKNNTASENLLKKLGFHVENFFEQNAFDNLSVYKLQL